MNESLNSAGVLVATGKSVALQAYTWNAHTLLSAVAISGASQNASTDASGVGGLVDINEASLALSASRTVPAPEQAATSAAVNVQDAISILKMVVGLEVNGPGKPLSPYQALAADVDGNGSINVSDAIAVLKHVVGLAGPDPTWHFVDELDLSVLSKATLTPGLPPSITAQISGVSPVHVGLVGYLTGDVDGSFQAPGTPQDLDVTQPTYFSALVDHHPALSLTQFGIYDVP